MNRRAVIGGTAALAAVALPPAAAAPSAGRLVELGEIASRRIDPRRVTVWLPGGYDADPSRRFPVLYMHDGQNLFDAARANFGVEWGIDEHLTALAAAGRAREAIVVGLWSTPKRFREYGPAGPIALLPAKLKTRIETAYGGAPLSDGYIDFIVDELKPTIDRTYRTLPGRADTVIMGSSMGGLISLYALCRRPATFGGAACLSTHWPLIPIDFDKGPKTPAPWQTELITGLTRYLARSLPRAGNRRLYFDHGDQHLDQFYAPYQAAVDRLIERRGYVQGRDVLSRSFPGTSHNEAAWNARADLPLTFLLGT